MKNNSWFDVPDDMSSATWCQTVCRNMSRKARSILRKLVWVVSTARNAIIVIVCALIAYGFDPVLPSQDMNTDMIELGHDAVSVLSSLIVSDDHSHSFPSSVSGTTMV